MNRVLNWPSRVLPMVTVVRVATVYARKRGLDKGFHCGQFAPRRASGIRGADAPTPGTA